MGMFYQPPARLLQPLLQTGWNDYVSVPFGSTSRRHRLHKLYAINLSHSHTSYDRDDRIVHITGGWAARSNVIHTLVVLSLSLWQRMIGS